MQSIYYNLCNLILLIYLVYYGVIMFHNKKYLVIFAVIAMLILTSAVFSFTAANTVPATRLGEGDNTISGYVVTDVDYATSDAYPSTLTTVTLTLDNTAEFVKISLDGGTSFYTCTNTAGTTWACDTSAAGAGSVLSASSLTVIAGD